MTAGQKALIRAIGARQIRPELLDGLTKEELDEPLTEAAIREAFGERPTQPELYEALAVMSDAINDVEQRDPAAGASLVIFGDGSGMLAQTEPRDGGYGIICDFLCSRDLVEWLLAAPADRPAIEARRRVDVGRAERLSQLVKTETGRKQ